MRTTIKQYYIMTNKEQNQICVCSACNNEHKIGDTILSIPDNKEYNIENIVTRCPMCNHSSYLKDDYK